MGATTLVAGYPERAALAPVISFIGSPILPIFQFTSALLGGNDLFPNMGRRQLFIDTNQDVTLMTYYSFDPAAMKRD